MKQKNAGISSEKAIDIAKTIFAIVRISEERVINLPLILNDEQRYLCDIFSLILCGCPSEENRKKATLK